MGSALQTWSVGVGGFLLGIAVLALKDWIGAKGRLLLDFLYGRFAGSRLLRRAALTKYVRELHRRHKEFPVSFQADEALKLPMESVYVPLWGGRPGDGTRERMEAALRRARHSVVLGVPGAGKTMLLRHETLMWARRRIRDDRRRVDLGDLRDIPVLLELHRLNKDPELSLEQHIVRHFARHGFPRADNWVNRALEQGRLALYFDGLDEVSTDLRALAVELLKEFRDTYADCRIVVTCRVAVYEGQFTEFDQTLRVRDLDEHLIRRFLGGWPWRAGTAADSVDQLLGALRDTPEIMQLARNPLLLTLIAYLYDFRYGGTDQVLPHTRAEFYKQVIDDLLSDRRRRSAFPHPVKKAVLLRLALVAQDVPSGTHDRLALPEAEVLNATREVLESQGRDPADAENVLTEIVERSGLLLAVDNGERYQFAHLTLQEYLAAAVLAADPSGLLRRYEADPQAWRETVRLWCGVEPRDCTNVVRGVLFHDPGLAFQCLADAHTVDAGLAAQLLDDFKGRLRQGVIDDQVISAFGLVAGDRRQRGREVFDFLVATMRSESTRSARVAARALAATNLPGAAAELADAAHAPTDPAWSALGLMGDLAVPAFSTMAWRHHDALTALWSIRTPKAARALNHHLWENDSPVVQYWCAFYLGDLLAVPEIEAELRTAPAPPQDTGYDPWVWRPFAHGPDDPLLRIAERIARVLRGLDVQQLSDSPPGLPQIDPRITAPIAVIDDVSTGYRISTTVSVSRELMASLIEALPSMRISSYAQEAETIDVSDFAGRVEAVYVPTTSRRDELEADPRVARLLDSCMALLGRAGLPTARMALLKLLPSWLRLRACVALLLAQPLAGVRTWDATPIDPKERAYSFYRGWYFRSVVLLWCALSGAAMWRSLMATMTDRPGDPQWLGWAGLAVVTGWLVVAVVTREDAAPVSGPRFVVVGMTVVSALYVVTAVAERWGVGVASSCAVTALGLSIAGVRRGAALEYRRATLSHPVRRLVLAPLLSPGSEERHTH
ncbi:NACHT domain-containing protein [Streptomyces phyllanthi]|uniref:NACHT domain-containing protein n=1 Tax=Streptomyces phyllanthi TaxID=1803180 RepID=A0A5N8WAM6_9ACTN|nr:NACHT domain-containing protein [Streptomyces phyllanthi]MPY43478.1 NACHT domain-containing protein [Streptomyces phyllanthi]